MAQKPLEIDMIAGSQLRDSQGEMLSVEGADISELEAGRGRFNDNHGKGFYNSIGRVTQAKKILKKEDCETERQKYFWDKVKSPYVYVKGELYNDEDHPNAKAAAAVIRNIHKNDNPLKMKASVEGGVVSRGIKDPSLLANTKIHSVALTFTPANQATLVEPTNLSKSDDNYQNDLALIKSVEHLAVSDVPSFRQIERTASAERIKDNFQKIQEISDELGLEKKMPDIHPEELAKAALRNKILRSVKDIMSLTKALCAGYGGAGVPTNMTGGGVFQSEAIDDGRTHDKPKNKKKKKNESLKKSELQYITCNNCGMDQVHMRHQCKCRKCKKSFSLEKIAQMMGYSD